MKTYILTIKTVELKNNNTVSSNIIGAYNTIEEAKAARADKVYEERKRINADSVFVMDDDSEMVNDKDNAYIFTIEERGKLTIDEQMKIWEARANDEFGQTLKEINEKAFRDWFNEDDEDGIISTPISHYITAYALDGDRKYTAKKVLSIVEEYDMMEDINGLADKLNKLAA